MGVQYVLVNQTKKELVSFSHLNGSKMRELAGNTAQSAIVAWYLLNNQGDEIQFVSDTYEDWPFKSGQKKDSFIYPDKTDELIDILIKNEILKDHGMLYVDEDEPETVYVRDIVNIWSV